MPDFTLQTATRSVVGVSTPPSVPPEQLAASLYPPDSTGIKQAGKEAILAVCRDGNIPPYTNGGNGGCTGANTGVGTQIESAGVGLLASAIPIPFIGGILQNIFSIFGQHHAAVANENKILCSAVPQAQAFFNQIDQAVATGQLSYVDAMNAMEQAFQQFSNGVSGIIKRDAAHCNASCYYVIFFRAAIEKRKNDYLLMGATLDRGAGGYSGATASGGLLAGLTSSLSSALGTSGGNSNLLLIGGLVLGGLFLFSMFSGGRREG